MVIWYVNPTNNDGNYEMTIINSCFQPLTTALLCIRCDAIGPASVNPQMVWPWKLQSSHLDSSNIFQKVLSHSPVSWSTGWGWEDLVRAVGPGNFYGPGLRWWLWGCRDVKVKSRSFWPRMATVRNRSLWTNTNYSTRFRTRLQAFTNVYSCAQIVSKATRTKTSLLFFSGVQIVLSIVLQFSVQHRNMFHYVPFIYIGSWTINSSILPAFIAQTSQHLVYLPFPPGPHGWNSGPYATQLLILLLDPQGHLREGITWDHHSFHNNPEQLAEHPEPSACIIRRGMSQSLHRDSTVSSSSRGREVLLNKGPQASLSYRTERKGRHVEICPVDGKQWSKNIPQDCWISESRCDGPMVEFYLRRTLGQRPHERDEDLSPALMT